HDPTSLVLKRTPHPGWGSVHPPPSGSDATRKNTTRLHRLRVDFVTAADGAPGLGRAAFFDHGLVNRAIPVDSGRDVARRHRIRIVGAQTRDLARSEEIRDDVALLALERDRVADVVPARFEHPLDEAVELGQDVRRRILELLLQRRPLTLPFVPIEAGLQHSPILYALPAFQTSRSRGLECRR